MTSPDSNDPEAQEQDSPDTDIPPAGPAYATPPTEGLPDADNP